MKWHRTAIAAMTALGLVALAAAHHSAAMFDSKKSMTLRGSVKAFQFINPHSWIQLLVTADGKTTEWSIEMGSPQGLYRSGWRPTTLKPDQQISVVVYPERNGSPVALFLSATQADGSSLVKAQP
jgi:Family of unknown function (DUF6152)